MKVLIYHGLQARETVDSPFFTLTEGAFDGGLTYTITSSNGDRRSTNNPSMQLLDYMSSKKYGKDFSTQIFYSQIAQNISYIKDINKKIPPFISSVGITP